MHGLYNKLLGGSARHLAIVQSVPGLDGMTGERVLTAVGIGEVAIALWVLSGWRPRLCAAAQTVALLSMNVVELTFARDLLLWPAGLIPLNLAFLALAWTAADAQAPLPARAAPPASDPDRGPLPRVPHADLRAPGDVLRPLLPPGLELETAGGYGFVAVALVQTEALRPAGLPAALGQDFFLAGYRVFTTFQAPTGRRSAACASCAATPNRARMVAGGNLLTHYNYHRCTRAVASERRPDPRRRRRPRITAATCG